MAYCSQTGVPRCSYIEGIPRFPVVFSRLATAQYHLIQTEAVLHCTVCTTDGRPMPSSGLLEGLTVFAENTGLVVGRTLVDSSRSSLGSHRDGHLGRV